MHLFFVFGWDGARGEWGEWDGARGEWENGENSSLCSFGVGTRIDRLMTLNRLITRNWSFDDRIDRSITNGTLCSFDDSGFGEAVLLNIVRSCRSHDSP